MGKDLYNEFPAAKRVFDEVNETLKFNLSELMFDGEAEELTLTKNAQPAILTHSTAILRVLEEEFAFKVNEISSYVLGHSLGEYTALVAAKALSLSDAVTLVRLRGQAMQESVSNKQSTAMSALVIRKKKSEEIEAALEKLRAELPEGEHVQLANINSVVISGTSKGVDAASHYLQAERLAARAVDLPVSAPFHCDLMKPAAEVMKEALTTIEFKQPIVDVIANVTGKPIKSKEEIPELLYQQVTGTVQWHRSIQYCKTAAIDDWVSFGPGRVLANLIKKEHPLDKIRPITSADDIFTHAEYFQQATKAT
ncbi:FabD/lysophospholipase-like protein [Basidiobolus meristosporus CBS 931.73]|uniref:[acyl-carrier-protein] S-malonyltransferase n=1 Tax=Basidiobolus meristosporus CBS 931.73 TaxID=1314790 RepID=A0A1Y1YYB9_9FUNG|nr:FabD/lysophospholipase-like protein [Basidiobolus meristosporus CBS 931.73]|eukprot:ORY03021.1 FabD/lysophospholipase-like protein [Basidiobolus meristosporus CBS 931.73]